MEALGRGVIYHIMAAYGLDQLDTPPREGLLHNYFTARGAACLRLRGDPKGRSSRGRLAFC